MNNGLRAIAKGIIYGTSMVGVLVVTLMAAIDFNKVIGYMFLILCLWCFYYDFTNTH